MELAISSKTKDFYCSMTVNNNYQALALFSGGLDSLLAAKTIMDQGLQVKCLHFISPFFGAPEKVPFWKTNYGLDIDVIDIGDAYIQMMQKGPAYGFGKHFNPCVACKIFMIKKSKELLPHYKASFLITGEVAGQRPMSQRRDTLNSIRNTSNTSHILLRPLCAKTLNPTPMELSGLVCREKLHKFSGRGRKNQVQLAQKMGINPIPTPAGGCLLTEKSSAKRYGPIFSHIPNPTKEDFYLANAGRQYWADSHWLTLGRNKHSNKRLHDLYNPKQDILFKLNHFPGPLAIGRQYGDSWPKNILLHAAAFTASFSLKAVQTNKAVTVGITTSQSFVEVAVYPTRFSEPAFLEPTWEETLTARNRIMQKKE